MARTKKNEYDIKKLKNNIKALEKLLLNGEPDFGKVTTSETSSVHEDLIKLNQKLKELGDKLLEVEKKYAQAKFMEAIPKNISLSDLRKLFDNAEPKNDFNNQNNDTQLEHNNDFNRQN